MSSSVQFHGLRVTEVCRQTDDAVSVTFEVPQGLEDRFTHRAGQHLVLRREIDGQDVRRSYSICAAPGEPLRVGIKRIPDGVFSTWATTELAPGEVIDGLEPIGEFTVEPEPPSSRNLVFIAAGSGITPILAMASTVLRDEPASQVSLLYGNRSSRSIMFQEELEHLKNRFPDRFQLIHVLSREPHQVPLFEGRIDEAKLRQLADGLLDVAQVDGWYLCGPLEMVESLSATLDALGVPEARVHSELFFDQRLEVPSAAIGADGATGGEVGEGRGDRVEFRFLLGGRTSTVWVRPEGPSLLDHARSVRAEVPFACKGGMCATCKAGVVEGEVTMAKNFALTDDELERGMVLTCQAHPVGQKPVVVSYDV
jgi:ring-1,2-phenylacetyl-CoA epoxidase subunit PaaE